MTRIFPEAERAKQHRPCGDCPWRKDATLGHWHRDHFVNIATECRGDGLHTMGCHKGGGRICAGWAAVEGFDAVGLRLAAMRGQYNPARLNIRGLSLFASMDEMIAANDAVYIAQGQASVRAQLAGKGE